MHSPNLQDFSSNSQGFAKLGEQQRRDVDEGARFCPQGQKDDVFLTFKSANDDSYTKTNTLRDE